MTENAKAYMSSSSLVLGLSPVLLSTLGPSISEIGLLSLNRPVLSALLALGTVAVFPSRALAYSDDSCSDILLESSTSLPVYGIFHALSRRPGLASLVSAAQYAVLALAVFNVFYTLWQLGVATILNFICQSSFMPIIWTTLPIIVHLPAALGYRFVLMRPGKGDRNGKAEPKPKISRTQTQSWKMLPSRLFSETNLSMMHKPIPASAPLFSAPSPVVLVCHWLATLFGFVHIIFGILIYSSLLFTMTTDAAVILLRYFASALACRLVLIFELAGMKWVQNGNGKGVADVDVVVQSDTEYHHLDEFR